MPEAMHTVTVLRATGVPPDQVKAVTTDYLLLEQARTYRRAYVARFGALAAAFGIAGFGAHWLTPRVSWFSVAMCGVAPAWAWMAELRREWMLARRLGRWPDAVTDVVSDRFSAAELREGSGSHPPASPRRVSSPSPPSSSPPAGPVGLE